MNYTVSQKAEGGVSVLEWRYEYSIYAQRESVIEFNMIVLKNEEKCLTVKLQELLPHEGRICSIGGPVVKSQQEKCQGVI